MYSNKVIFVLRQRETFYKKRKSSLCRLDKGPFIFLWDGGRADGIVGGGGGTRKMTVRGVAAQKY